MSHFTPDAEIDNSVAGLGILEGRAAIRGFFEEWIGYTRSTRSNLRRFTISVGAWLGRGQSAWTSPWQYLLCQLRYAAVTIFRDGLIEQQTNYTDIAGANAAAERLAQERADG